MEYIYYALEILFVIVTVMVSVKICMWVANFIGEQLGIGKFLIYLWRKIRRG